MGASLSISKSVSNTSNTAATVSATLKITATGETYNEYSRSGYLTIDGTKYSFSKGFSKGKTTTLKSASKSIARTTAAKSITIKGYYSTGVSPGNLSKSTTTTVSARPAYTVTFANGYGGTHSTATVYYGYTTTFPSITRTGYTFNKWNGTYAAGATTPAITGATTYTAQWTINTYTVTLVPQNGASSYTTTKTYGSNLTIPAPSEGKLGYTFVGWNTAADGSGTDYTTYTLNEAITLYAIWRINVYNITLDAAGGTCSDSVLEKTYGIDIDLPTPTWTGHIFAGWSYIDSNNNSTNIGNICAINENTTLVAIWSNAARPINLYRYSSVNNDSSTYAKTLYKVKNTPINSLPQPNISGYVFKGWFTAASGGTQVTSLSNESYDYEDDSQYDNVQPINLYAHWNILYTCTFNAVDPINESPNITYQGSVPSIEIESGATLTLPSSQAFTYMDGGEAKYIANGWKQGSNSSSIIVADGAQITNVNSNLDFYVNWQIQQFKITLNPGNGQGGKEIVRDYYSLYTLPTTAAAADMSYDNEHSLDKWISNGVTFNGGTNVRVTTNKVFTATWISNYTIPTNIISITRRIGSDPSSEISEGGKYLHVTVSGTLGIYKVNGTTISPTNGYSYTISYTLPNQNEIINEYTSNSLNVSQSYIIYDKALSYDSISINFVDTSIYEGHTISLSDRTVTNSRIVPLKRQIGIHIADDLHAISFFDELDDVNDTGLVVHKIGNFQQGINVQNNAIFNDGLMANKVITLNKGLLCQDNATFNKQIIMGKWALNPTVLTGHLTLQYNG